MFCNAIRSLHNRTSLGRNLFAPGKAGALLLLWLFAPLSYAQIQIEPIPRFEDPVFYPVVESPWAVAVGDINEDGHPDLAVTGAKGEVTIYLNTGDWSDLEEGLVLSQTLIVPYPWLGEVAFADLRGDQHLDLVVAQYLAQVPSYLFVWKNDRANLGQFLEPPDQYSVGRAVLGLVAGDMNFDGFDDVALAATDQQFEPDRDKVVFFRNLADGTWALDGPYEEDLQLGSGYYPHDLVLGNFAPSITAGPALPDLVTANYNHDSISMLHNLGNRQFNVLTHDRPQGCATDSWEFWTITAGRYNGDNYDDVAAADEYSEFAAVFLADGQGGFKHDCTGGTDTYKVYPDRTWIAGSDSGHLNGGTRTDLVFSLETEDLVSVLIGKGDGKFQTPAPHDRGYLYSVDDDPTVYRFPIAVKIVDLNMDGFGDLVTVNNGGHGPNGDEYDISVLINKTFVLR